MHCRAGSFAVPRRHHVADILIVYGTTHGHTERIVRLMAHKHAAHRGAYGR